MTSPPVQHFPGSATRARARVIDLLCVTLVPTVLLVVFALPEQVRLAYVLRYTEPTLLTAYTAHFVHLESGHLASNLVAYLLVVPLTYLLSVLAGRRGWFLLGFGACLLVFPVALSGLNVLLFRPRIGYGFSGLNMAFLGLLPVVLTGYLERTVDGVELDDAPLLFLLGAGLVGGLVAGYVPQGTTVTLVAGLAVVPYLRRLWRGFEEQWSLRRAGTWGGQVEVTTVALLVFVTLIVAAFPPDPVEEGLVLNLYLHLLGYGFGFIVPFSTFSLLGDRWDPSKRTPVTAVRADGGDAQEAAAEAKGDRRDR